MSMRVCLCESVLGRCKCEYEYVCECESVCEYVRIRVCVSMCVSVY